MVPGRFHFLLWLALGTFLAMPQLAGAQAVEGKKAVRFNTVDGVELHGSYYAAAKKNAPIVILLHSLGETSRTKNWAELAETLQKGDFNVLAFDFRGHGQSTEIVEPASFWACQPNQTLPGAGKIKSLDFKMFSPTYLPILVNDIAAARAYLERTKNDNGACNTANILLIGSETGATLGTAWMTSEWFRYKLNPPQMAGMLPQIDKRQEGKDIVGAVWLSISPKLSLEPAKEGKIVRLDLLLNVPVKIYATPMVFMYGEGDKQGKNVAISCERALKVAKSEKHQYITAFELKNTKLTGVGLLQKSLGTNQAIVKYLTEVVDVKGNEWGEREFRKNPYVWRFPPTANAAESIIAAKPANELLLYFDTYDKFFPRQ